MVGAKEKYCFTSCRLFKLHRSHCIDEFIYRQRVEGIIVDVMHDM